MGGSDPSNLTLLVAKSLSQISGIDVKLILGPFYKNKIKLKKL